MHTLGIRLRELRKKQGLTKTQVAERLGVSKAVVSSYEVASRCPSYDILIKLATLYNVSTDYLLGLDNRHFIDVSSLTPVQLAAVEAVLRSYKNN